MVARHGNVYLLSEERARNQTKYITEAMRIFGAAEKSLKASKLKGPLTAAGPKRSLEHILD